MQDAIMPRFCGNSIKIPETGDQPLSYSFMLGRGTGGAHEVTRRLEDGVLPILHSTRVDGDVAYHSVMFATLASKPLTDANVRGTDYLVADGHGLGHMFTPEQQAEYDRRLPAELATEEIVLCVQVTAVNNAAVPRYAFVMAPDVPKTTWDANGCAKFESGRIAGVHRLNGQPLPEKMAAK